MKTKKLKKLVLNQRTIATLTVGNLKKIWAAGGGEPETQVSEEYYTLCAENSRCSDVAGPGCTTPPFC